jgi:subtilase family serine protease
MKLTRFKLSLQRCGLFAFLASLCVALPLQIIGQALVPAVPQITQVIDGSKTVRIPGSVYPATTTAMDLGTVSPDLPLERMVLVLKPSPERAAALIKFLDEQQNVASSNYHRWLTPQQFAQQYGPAPADVQQVQGWLHSQGLQVTRVASGGWWIQFSSTAQQVSRAFGTSIHTYNANGKIRTANASSISIPEALAPAVYGLLSLHSFPRLPNHTKIQSVVRSSTGQLVPQTGKNDPAPTPEGTFGGGAHYLSPGDMAAIYDTNPLLNQSINGTGVSIAVIGQTDVQLADIESFRSIFNLPANDPQVIVDGNDPGFSSGDEEESDLDLEYAGALAPQAKILFVTSGGTLVTAGIDLSAAYAVDNVLAPIITLSYGSCEANLNTAGNAFYNQLWQQAAAEGITVFVAAGDSGSAGCDGGGQQYLATFGLMVSGLASTPYDIAVGGTAFAEGPNASSYWSAQNGAGYTSALGYIPETAWNDSCDLVSYTPGCVYSGGQTNIQGGGGGVSNCTTSIFSLSGYTCMVGYTKPSWQAGPGVPNDGKRDIPDLSLTSSGDHDGYLVCTEGSCQTAYQNGVMTLQTATVIGGTSAAAPSMAGIMALVEQKNGSFQGQANYTFYKLAAMQNTASCNSSNLILPGTATTCIFHDITTGTNAAPCFGSSKDCSTTLNGLPGLLNGYAAGPGYDAATGLGSVDATNLATAWQTTGLANSATKLTLGTSTAIHGSPVMFKATVQPSSGTGTPTGDLSLSGAGQNVGPFTLTGGTYSGSTSALPGGTYTVSAHYAGDASYQSSISNAANLTVTPEASTIGLQLYFYNIFTNQTGPVSGPVPFGAPLYYLAQIQGVSTLGVATGNVTFTLDGTSLGAYPINGGGQAAVDYSLITLPYVLPGSHTIAASYPGDNSFKASTSPAATLVVSPGQVSTYALPNVSNTVQGQPVQVLINLGGTYLPLPSGTIQLYDNGVALGAPLALSSTGIQGNGVVQAVYNSSTFAVGTHKLVASYSGDTIYASVAITSTNANQSTLTVKAPVKLTSAVTIVPSASTLSVGQNIQYAIKVTPTAAGGPTPTGTITLLDPNPLGVFGFTIAPSTSLSNGTLTSTQTFYGSGDLLVYASYSGDSNYEAAVSPVVLTVYNTISPTAVLSANAAYTLPGTQSSITIQVSGHPNLPVYAVPTGAVQYLDSLNGAAAKLIATHYLSVGNGNVGVDTLPALLATGSHTLTAQYTGDSNWSAIATNPITVLVTQPDFSLATPSGATTALLGITTAATITATPLLSYSGSIVFSCTGGVPSGASCAFSPATVATSSVPASTVLNLSTTAPTIQTALSIPVRPGQQSVTTIRFAGSTLFACLLLLVCAQRRPKLRPLVALLVCFLLSTTGCTGGGGNTSKTPTAFTLRSDFGTKAVAGSNVSFTATVPGANSAGTVTFTDGSTPVGTAAVSNNKANLQLTSLAPGTHPITATYQPSTGTPLSATLQQGITGTAIVQVTGISGTLSHTINVSYLLQ